MWRHKSKLPWEKICEPKHLNGNPFYFLKVIVARCIICLCCRFIGLSKEKDKIKRGTKEKRNPSGVKTIFIVLNFVLTT